MDEGLLRNMAEAGCKEIYYGIESGSNRILEWLFEVSHRSGVDTIE
jgi:radical SAM superfamily enzyme YgiQ (UPF0313 family)